MPPIHVISSYIHHSMAEAIHAFSPKSALDMGGVGKLQNFLCCEVTDANITDNLDGTCLPFADNTFDVAVSIATLEHVGDWRKFLQESSRVSRTAAMHWFPWSSAAIEAEYIKKRLGHVHPCSIPDGVELQEFLSGPECGVHHWTMAPLMTIGEHLLLLGTINPNLNHPDAFEVVSRIGSEPYGVLLTMHKNEAVDDPG